MSNYQKHSSRLSIIGMMMILGGSLLSILVDELAWVGIGIALIGLLLSLSLLFVQWRAERQAEPGSTEDRG